ncbi:MAG: hypothetical protein JRE40_16150 [Deltaproteobacteria bacterium]|nr:hypothetical protein [Deltaproteobacteria bacterium]
MYDELQEANRNLTKVQVGSLTALSETILEPIREKFRLPITISSGYRSEELNDRIGGSLTSQHSLCEAADIIINGLDDLEGSLHVFEWIYMESGLEFGQLIHEHKVKNCRESIWIHISLGVPYRDGDRCKQVFKYRKSEYIRVPNPMAR